MRDAGDCLALLLPVLLSVLGAPAARAQRTAQRDFPTIPSPTVLIQIKFTPGTASTWEKAFREDMVPSLREAIDRGDQVTGFQYYEPIAPRQVYDFLLVLEVKTFAFFDEPREYPHYQALFRHLDQPRAQQVVDVMKSCEATVTITLLQGYMERNIWGIRH